jgi:tetratricopeptide (TPR) repeat protein
LAYDVAKEGLVLLIGFGLPAIYFLGKLVRREIQEGFQHITHDFEKALLSIAETTRQKLDDGFLRIGGDFVEAFRKSLNDNIIPLLKESMEATRRALVQSWPNLLEVPIVGKTEAADIQRFIDAADFEGLYRQLDSTKDAELKAAQYREVATICMAYEDRFHSIEAANKYRELLGRTIEAERFLGYVYWWFKDVDTAIVHTEIALQLALNSEQDLKKDPSLGYKIKNNLAFYYALTQSNREKAFSYVGELLANTSPADDNHVYYIDTAGAVYLKFAASEEDVDKAIQYFLQVLELEPQSKHTQAHLIEAYEKKKSFKKAPSVFIITTEGA